MQDHYEVYLKYKSRVDEILSGSIEKQKPATLYEPLKYILNGGGKRIRSMLVIFSCEAAGGTIEDSIYASAALEMLHNFTLVHDDIMDNANTRRGRETIHKKWNDNVAILCGDQLIGMAYTYLLKTKSSRLEDILKIFTGGIIEVCEGQSYDKEFEKRNDVTLEEYIMMINKKTAKMLETSAIIGTLIGNGNEEKINNIKNYALNLGLAFQIQDDLLDISADETELGKKIGGDLVEGKKTYLLLKAAEVVSKENDKDKIRNIINSNRSNFLKDSDIIEIKDIYVKYGIIDFAKKEIERYTQAADQYLDTLPEGIHKERLKWFSGMLMSRSF